MFFMPSVVLGMPTPMLVKLTLPSLATTGRVVGDVQAAATAGSILGVFLTGYFADLVVRDARDRGRRGGGAAAPRGIQPTRALTDTEPGRAERSQQPALAIVPVVVLVASRWRLAMTADSRCIKESNYFCIDVGAGRVGS